MSRHVARAVLSGFSGRHEVVALADDAFSFLVAWEFMSLSSWALVLAHHQVPDNVRAGYVYILMASFGTLAFESNLESRTTITWAASSSIA